jgi:poly(A) polymerase
MARAINKNKKPETNNKNRARNYFLGELRLPL